jgi:hypothetical protein
MMVLAFSYRLAMNLKKRLLLSADRRVANLIHDHQRRFIVASSSAFALGIMIFSAFDQVLHGGK